MKPSVLETDDDAPQLLLPQRQRSAMLSFPVAKWQKLNPTLSRSKKIAQFNACASLIVPRLYLADYRTASDGDELRRLGITHIVSVIDFTPVFPDCIDKDNILHIPVADKSEVRILPFLPQTTQFIRDALEQDVANRVLVRIVAWTIEHCRGLIYIITTGALRPRDKQKRHSRVRLFDGDEEHVGPEVNTLRPGEAHNSLPKSRFSPAARGI
ncbi:hypothetical protein EYR40_006573 [Pleurotus pulmonarius]|nr:hypothetical protein EYR36_011194 [Pleurotus pulmonarius]KAF4599479.1 hypothetical protein EYR40_006573 [Pleurotus pulmonarius]